jgi:hypothetical protein
VNSSGANATSVELKPLGGLKEPKHIIFKSPLVEDLWHEPEIPNQQVKKKQETKADFRA